MKAWVIKNLAASILDKEYWDGYSNTWDKLYYACLHRTKHECYNTMLENNINGKPVKVEVKEL